MTRHLTYDELNAGLDEIKRAPKDEGTLRMIVCRPQAEHREVLEEGKLDLHKGLVGDSWHARDGVDRDTQINVMGARVIALVAQEKERWPLAGDQLYIDMDLSETNLPPGTQLSIGEAVIEITPEPHTGCRKFMKRFGADAAMWVNSPEGKELHLRGLNARVVKAGRIRVGDLARKL